MKRAISIAITLLMLMSGMFVVVNESTGSENTAGISSAPGNNVPLLTSHAPIRINNDTDFADQAAGEGWKGSGTQTDPYVIENYDINGTNYGYCIYIGNTTVHFVVRNCSLHDANGNPNNYFWNSGVVLYNVKNGTLDNNTASNNAYYGIYLEYSGSNTIENNNASSNYMYGIHLEFSSSNTIENNNASNNHDGIYLSSSSNNTITNNTASNNFVGIYLSSSSSNNITNNTASNNYYGIYLDSSSSNNITNNTASSNIYYGIYLSSSSRNTLTNNTMVDDGILIRGNLLKHWNTHSIDTSNTVNGKPVYYWKNQTGGTVPAGAGEVILANSTNVIVENQDVSDGSVGIELGFSTSCTIQNNTGSNNWYGICLSSSSNNTIANNTASNDYYGICLSSSSNNTITNNTASNNFVGIYLSSSSNNTITNNTASLNRGEGICLSSSSSNTITNNTASSNNWHGIFLYSSSSNTIANNTASSNNWHGIFLYSSSSNTITNNTMIYDGIFIEGSLLEHWNTHTIDTSNTVNGKPVYYLKSQTGGTVPAGAGEVILANSTDIIVENQNVSDGSAGIELGFSTNCTIQNNTASSNNGDGIYLYSSDRNTIINNTASNNFVGIYLSSSSNNTIANNTANWNNDDGIRLDSSSNNTIANNNASNNYYGIRLYSSSNNTIANNTASSNDEDGMRLDYSSNNTLTNNTANSNTWEGIHLYSSSNNTITNNIASSNTWYGIYLLSSSSNNIITNNTASNNKYGIYLLSSSSSNAIENNTASNNGDGIYLSSSSNNTIANNTASNNFGGIYLSSSSSNRIENNTASNNGDGIYLSSSSNNTITNNIISSNSYYGIYMPSSGNNTIYHNNFLNNTDQAYDNTGTNRWNASYPEGGNYWSDYNGTDNYSGPSQNLSGSDGIGDTPYTNISGGSGAQDYYPLMEPTVDLTPPNITITSPSDGAILSTSSVTIYWNGSDSESGINHYEIRNDSGSWIDVGLNTSYTFTGLSDGFHTVDVKAVDNASNENTDSVTFTVDATPPAVISTAPVDGASSVPVTQNVVVIYNESMNTTVSPTLTQTSGTVVTYTFAGWSTTTVANDTATWTHTAWNYNETIGLNVSGAQDLAGNVQNNYSWSFTTEAPDTTPPSSSISPISPYWQNSQLTLTINATDDKDLSNITLYYRFSTDNSSWSNWTQFGSPILASGTSWSGTITFTFPDGDGYYEFYTIARDAAGNNETKTKADAICGYDTTSPEITLDSPSDGAIFNITNVTVSWHGSDVLSGIDHYEIRINSGSWIDAGLSASYTLTGLSDDFYTVEVKVIDNASNENTTSITFTVDTTPPAITITAPSEDSLHTADVQLTWHGTDATEIDHYEIRMDSDNWTNVGTDTTYHFENLTDGTHTFYVRAMDNAGNTAIAEVNFTVDATPPTITAHSPTGNDVSVDTVITVTFSEEMDQNTVSIDINGLTGTIAWNNNTATFTPSQNLSYDTKYTVYVTGSDPAGNAMQEYTWSFTTTDIGTITGTVTDKDGNPIEGATVTLETGETAITDENGHFEIQAHAGNHTLTISKDGYETETRSTSVTPGEETSLPPVELPKSKAPAGELPWLWIALLIIIIVVVVALLIAKRKKSPGMPLEKEQPMEPTEETEEAPMYGQAEGPEEMAGEEGL